MSHDMATIVDDLLTLLNTCLIVVSIVLTRRVHRTVKKNGEQ